MTLRIPLAKPARAPKSPQPATSPPRPSLRERVSVLVGDKLGLVLGLAAASILSGFTEAATLALLAQLAYSLARGAHHVHQHIGPFAIHASLPTLLKVAFAFTILRLLLQIPISYMPARIASDVQRKMRLRLFHAFSRASWAVQARDREGLLQETMSSQVSQASAAAMQMTSLISASLMFIVLLASALLLNVLAAAVVLFIAL